MRKTFLRLLVILVCIGMVTSCRKSGVLPTPVQEDPESHPAPPPEEPKLEETQPAVLTGITLDISPNIKGFYQALPARYDESDQKYPLIIYFHGGGQYGNGSTDLSLVLKEGIPKRLNEKTFPPSFTVDDEQYSFIVIAPQFVKRVNNSDIDSLLNYIKANYRIDRSRIYLSGLSLGARMLSDYAAYNPEEIAAVTAMAGLPQLDEHINEKCKAMADAELPVWQFHNRDDSAWYYSEASRYIEIFNELNPVIAPKFTTFEVGEARLHHDCWTRTTDPDYREDGKNIYEWMLQYTR